MEDIQRHRDRGYSTVRELKGDSYCVFSCRLVKVCFSFFFLVFLTVFAAYFFVSSVVFFNDYLSASFVTCLILCSNSFNPRQFLFLLGDNESNLDHNLVICLFVDKSQ